jgi:hypothetical protein
MASPTVSAFAEGMGFKLTRITVTPVGGSSSRGPVAGDPVDRDVYLEDARETVRSANGAEETSESSLFDDLDKAGLYEPGAAVKLPDRTARVIKVSRNEIGDPDVDHCRVWLT